MRASMQEVKSLVNQNLPSICSLFMHMPADAPGSFQNSVVFHDSAALLAARLQVRDSCGYVSLHKITCPRNACGNQLVFDSVSCPEEPFYTRIGSGGGNPQKDRKE